MQTVHSSPRNAPAVIAPIGGLLAALLVLLLMNSQYLFAQITLWIQPGHTPQSALVDQAVPAPVSQDPRIIIPKINVDAPTVYGMPSTREQDIQKALQTGVLHYAGSPLPGEAGNSVFVGHSSNAVWAKGDYKFIFALLEKLEIGDVYYLHQNGVRYTYRVSDKKTVPPTDISVLAPTERPSSTLITCTPVGTNLNRLIIRGEQISPVTSTAMGTPSSSAPVTTLPGL